MSTRLVSVVCGDGIRLHEPVILDWTLMDEGFVLHAYPLRLYPTGRVAGIAFDGGYIGDKIRVLAQVAEVCR